MFHSKKRANTCVTLVIAAISVSVLFTACPNPVGDDTIHVDGVSLDKTSLQLEIGKTFQLTATVSPTDATNKSVTWSSSDNDVATVDNSGLVTAVSKGTAIITVTTADGGKTASCTVTVDDTIHVDAVSLDKTSLYLAIGEKSQLTATVSPANATNKSVTWSSSVPDVATVDNSGLVTAVSAGTATITVTTADGGKTASCTVNVVDTIIHVDAVSLDKTSLQLAIGEKSQLTATVSPANATNQSVTWSSSDDAVATVDNSGLVSAVSAGTATITVTTEDGGKTASCTVTVVTIPVNAVSLDKTSLQLAIGEKSQLTATVSPANATNKSVTWSSSAPAIATVTSSGLVSAVSAGTAIITVTTEDGEKTASCTVTVTKVFNAYNMATETTYQVTAIKRAEGTYSVVYVDQTKLASVPTATAEAICNEFDTKIYNVIRTNFAEESDVDHNGKIIMLLLDIQDGFDPESSPGYVAGYFDPTDLYSKSTYSASNEADMIYIDIYPSEIGSVGSYSTIAHEFQHLVNFNKTVLERNFQQDVWINEGLSSGAEYLYRGSHVQDRIDYYNSDPMGTIQYGNNFFVWNGYWEQVKGDVLADYSTVYLFFQWLRIHASNSSGIYKEILNQSYGDYRAVTNTASTYINSQFSDWETLLRTWLLAPLIKDPSGYMGYKDEIDVSAWCFNSTGGTEWVFSPGEGIFTLTANGSYTPGSSGTNIRYVGISSGPTIDTTGPDYTGDIILTFNANSNCNGLDETGYLSNTLTRLSSYQSIFNTVSNSNAMPSKYAVSILKSPGGELQSDSHKPGKTVSKNRAPDKRRFQE